MMAKAVTKSDRLTLIKMFKNMVYAKIECSLESYHNELLKLPAATKYPHFLEYVASVWEKRHTWAHFYRTTLPIRGNHTNNYAKAGIRIL